MIPTYRLEERNVHMGGKWMRRVHITLKCQSQNINHQVIPLKQTLVQSPPDADITEAVANSQGSEK